MEQDIEKLSAIVTYFVAKLIEEDNEPLAVAGVLSAMSMTIYKAELDDFDYDKMVDTIHKSSKKFKNINETIH